MNTVFLVFTRDIGQDTRESIHFLYTFFNLLCESAYGPDQVCVLCEQCFLFMVVANGTSYLDYVSL